MNASLEDLSLSSRRVFVQIMTLDGNTFDMPATEDVHIANFMGGVKSRGGVGNENWYVPYGSILWVAKIQYNAVGAASVDGMVRQ